MTKIQDKILTLTTFENSYQAHLFRSYLAENNIDSYIFDENIVTLNPLYNNLMGGIKLQISSLDIDKAQELLNEYNSANVTNEHDEIIQCPRCRSNNVDTNFKSASSIKSKLAMAIAFLTFTYPLHFENMYYCRNCKNPFKKE